MTNIKQYIIDNCKVECSACGVGNTLDEETLDYIIGILKQEEIQFLDGILHMPFFEFCLQVKERKQQLQKGQRIMNCQKCIDCQRMVGGGKVSWRCYGRQRGTSEYKRDLNEGKAPPRISPAWCPRRAVCW